jgi:hypothetical protein
VGEVCRWERFAVQGEGWVCKLIGTLYLTNLKT